MLILCFVTRILFEKEYLNEMAWIVASVRTQHAKISRQRIQHAKYFTDSTSCSQAVRYSNYTCELIHIIIMNVSPRV